ncbi:MAG: type VII toxin-antitoxin system HepT family RNase toxin [Methanoculleus sp.]
MAVSSSRRPETYRESFAILCDEGLIPEDLSIQLSDLAGFRNVLVHIYCRLNLDEVYGVLQDDLPVVNRYRDLVRTMLRDRLLPE